MDRKEELKKDFAHVLERWEEAMKATPSELSRDAAILRFELAFEVAWKLVRVLVQEEGALASLANVDVLVSWNFKHIVHYDKIRLFNAVNIENGLKSIDIYSPREVTNYEE